MHSSNVGLNAAQAAALFNCIHNGVIGRIDQRAPRAGDLFQRGLHPHAAASGSTLAAGDAAFAEAYLLTLAGPHAVTEHALFPR